MLTINFTFRHARRAGLALTLVFGVAVEAQAGNCDSLLDAARIAAESDVATLADAAACLSRDIADRARLGGASLNDIPGEDPLLGGSPGGTALFSIAGAMLSADRMDEFGRWMAARGRFSGTSLWAEYEAFSVERPMAMPDPDGPLLSANTVGGPQVFVPVAAELLRNRSDLRRLLRPRAIVAPQAVEPARLNAPLDNLRIIMQPAQPQ